MVLVIAQMLIQNWHNGYMPVPGTKATMTKRLHGKRKAVLRSSFLVRSHVREKTYEIRQIKPSAMFFSRERISYKSKENNGDEDEEDGCVRWHDWWAVLQGFLFLSQQPH